VTSNNENEATKNACQQTADGPDQLMLEAAEKRRGLITCKTVLSRERGEGEACLVLPWETALIYRLSGVKVADEADA
jgi:hypothetical protein